MSILRPLKKNILFQFEDELTTYNGIKQFSKTTNWGFRIGSNFDTNLKEPKWVKVIAVGPDVTEVKPGMRVLVEALKWTEGMKHEDYTYWMTNEDQVIMIYESE